MFTISALTLLCFSLSLLLSVLAMTLGKKLDKQREKLTPFECGFDPLNKARMPFSLRFFLVTILFLIFDVEIVILLPLSAATHIAPFQSLLLLALVIILILILGLLHEWNQGALDWAS